MKLPEFCRRIVEASWFTGFIITVIVFAGILVGLETSASLVAEHGGLIDLLNNVVLAIFVAEIILKMTAACPKPWRFFNDGWNVFDFLIVAVCFLPLGASFAPVLRLFRLFRVLRLVSVIPKLQVIVSALLRCLPSATRACGSELQSAQMSLLVALFCWGRARAATRLQPPTAT